MKYELYFHYVDANSIVCIPSVAGLTLCFYFHHKLIIGSICAMSELMTELEK